MKSYTLRVLADHLNADVQGDDSVEISTVGTLAGAGLVQSSFLANAK
jgi:UDP-3-O-[3-hydroxymyristoyl] glucosamine N-acyltransferase